jgi:undecaprenyl-diphosphatase
MNAVTTSILGLHGPLVYAVLAALVFLEAAAFVGLVVPGETAMVVAGVLAARGNLSLPVVLGLGIVAAVAGDSVGYAIGRRFGPAIQASRLGRWVGEPRWLRANEYVQDRGAWAVVTGRWVGIMRALVPSVAGMVGMPYRRFLVANVLGGVAWVSAVTALGYLVGGSLTRAESLMGQLTWVIAAAVVTGVLVALWVSRRRGSREQLGRSPDRHRLVAWLVPLSVLATATLAVVELADGVREGGDLAAYDPVVAAEAVASRTMVITPLAQVVTFLGSTVSIGAMALALVAWVGWRRRQRVLAMILAGSMAASAALTVGLKLLLARPRPPAALVMGPVDTGFAFPSGHTLNSTVFFGLLAGLALTQMRTPGRKVAVVALWLAASLAVAASRVYLGYHWMTDVMGGFGVGVGVLAATVIAWILAGRPGWSSLDGPSTTAEVSG